jgi:hypothetical protein
MALQITENLTSEVAALPYITIATTRQVLPAGTSLTTDDDLEEEAPDNRCRRGSAVARINPCARTNGGRGSVNRWKSLAISCARQEPETKAQFPTLRQVTDDC